MREVIQGRFLCSECKNKSGCIGETPNAEAVDNTEATRVTGESVETNTPESVPSALTRYSPTCAGMYRVKRKRLHPRLGNKRLEEWALFHGDATITNANGAASFDGLDKQLTTNVVDLAGASLTGVGNTVKEVDRLIKKIRLQGGQPTHLFTSFGMQSQINQIVAPDARYIIADGTTVTAGIHAVNYQSPAGVMPVVGDFIEKSPVFREEDVNNMTISVKLSAMRQYRGKSFTAVN